MANTNIFGQDNGQSMGTSNPQSQSKSSRKKGKQGFASMNPDEQRRIASKGGKAAHAKGTAHEWTPEEAKAAGRKGGSA